ncbi:peptide-methionine (S)-S-oxide reductase MsrA [Chondromyces apiculatus]|uniref:Peptide methionine sulfoxide reductase MsrA n=1 Tax=Chondromyces apiculatus DSM 436 TaxID=1192034 RepID=A0A017TA47_9BACT|nr:peptide-methionine (S)-S-oxide reductase MsrA [Chondromyces apiculatus]EYF06084.1 Peptide methionine sulfoxide reductase MsrA [Chondromyces apiculatus DSM 436]
MRTLPALLPLLASLLLACQTPPGAQASSASNAPAGTPAGEGNQGTPKLTSDKLIAPGPDGRRPTGTDPGSVGQGTPLTPRPGHELAAFAAGCFWGVEDAFRQIPGVTATAVGYTGGHTKNPTYEEVCDHGTGHAEAVLVEFDPKVLSYERLLKAFFQIHDPTTLNRQGPDEGDQYRSGIFTFSEAQAEATRRALVDAQAQHQDKIVTKVEPIGSFYKAEGYHQQYSERTGHHGCPVGKLTGI